jgi:hypothetical protein
MHATDLVGINILLVYTCQQGVYPQGHVLPLRIPPAGISHNKSHGLGVLLIHFEDTRVSWAKMFKKHCSVFAVRILASRQ